MASHRKVIDRDRGWKKFRARGEALANGPGVTVGIHANKGATPHKGKGKDERPLTILEVGYVNEFGLGVPERSFIRAWFDAAKPENVALAQRMLRRILKGQISLETALEQMGASFVGAIQKRIALGVPPPNAPATIAAKGSSKPLIATGQMRQSVTFVVVKK